MKSTYRLVLGALSSALLTVGLARAAGHLDPMNRSLPGMGATPSGSAPSCGSECFLVAHGR